MLKTVTARTTIAAFLVGLSMSAYAIAETQRIDIPAGSLLTALETLAKQANVDLVYQDAQLKGLRTGGVAGDLSPHDAVVKLLEGTPLQVRTDEASGAILITTPPARAPAAAPVTPAPTPTPAPKKSFWSRLRLAETDTSSTPQTDSVSPVSSQEEGTVSPAKKSAVEEIVVTGSRLRGAPPTSQVITIERDEIERKGVSTTEDIIRSIAQNFSALNTTSALDNSAFPAGSQGNSAANLRGLGPENTLILINGRRVAGGAIFSGSTVNLSTIPASAVERVEILSDGASAIYGSDAIGGVINFILKQDDHFSAESRGRYENSANGGDGYSLNQTLSFGWPTGHTTAALGYESRKPVTSRSIGYTSQDFTERGGRDNRSDAYGQPGIVLGFGALPAGNDGTHASPADFSLDNVHPISLIPTELNSSLENRSLYWNVEQRAGERTTLFADVLISRNDSDRRNGASIVYFQLVPASNAFNTFGEDVFVSYRFQNELESGLAPDWNTYSESERLNVSVGADIDLARDWRLNITGNFSKEDNDGGAVGIPVFGPTPQLEAALADSNPATALNLFGDGRAQNPQTLAGLVTDQLPFTITSNLKGLSTVVNGALARIPAGVITTAVGAEYRREALNISAFGDTYPNADRTVAAVFTEVAVPLTRSVQAVVAGRYEEYRAAGDFDFDGTDDGGKVFNQFSPKIGLVWQASERLKLRATWSKAFRAPALGDLYGRVFELPAGNSVPFDDPLAPAGTPTTVEPLFRDVPNPDIGPETATSWSAGLEWSGSQALSGLRASLNYSHIDFTDRITDGLDMIFNNMAVVLGNHDLFPGVAIRDNVNSAGVRGLLADDPNVVDGTLVGVISTRVNIASRESESLDFNVRYQQPTERLGTLDFGVSAVRTLKLRDRLVPATDPMELVGTPEGPDRWRWIVNAAWDYRSFNTNVYLNHSSSYRNYFRNRVAVPDGVPVSGYTTVDLTVNYKLSGHGGWLEDTRLSLGARNLFDKKFPFIDTYLGPFDPTRVDIRGRTAFLEVSKAF